VKEPRDFSRPGAPRARMRSTARESFGAGAIGHGG
jgi:hypothetical protein